MERPDLIALFTRYLSQGLFDSTLYRKIMKELQRRSLLPPEPLITTEPELLVYNFVLILYDRIVELSKNPTHNINILSNVICTKHSPHASIIYKFTFSRKHSHLSGNYIAYYKFYMDSRHGGDKQHTTSLSVHCTLGGLKLPDDPLLGGDYRRLDELFTSHGRLTDGFLENQDNVSEAIEIFTKRILRTPPSEITSFEQVRKHFRLVPESLFKKNSPYDD